MLRLVVTLVVVSIAALVWSWVVAWLTIKRRPSRVLVACAINTFTLYCIFAIIDEFRDGLTGWGVVRVGLWAGLALRTLVLSWFHVLAMDAGDPSSESV